MLFGLFVGIYWFVTAESSSWLVLGTGLAFAAVAYAYGDRFWHWLIRYTFWY